MIDCMIIGDSIAVGTHHFRHDCVSYSQGGINSQDWNKKYKAIDLQAKTVIISLGSNDIKTLHTFNEIMALRQRVDAKNVMWILPANKPHKAELVQMVAKAFNDTVLAIPEVSKDGVHPSPSGYKKLAETTKEK
jgi:lysophospholipase L1-like esterase